MTEDSRTAPITLDALVIGAGFSGLYQLHRLRDDLGLDTLVLETAGLTELFERAFDASYELYSKLQAAGYAREAEYATLLGHRMRWRVRHTAAQSKNLLAVRNIELADLIAQFEERLSEIHPTLYDHAKN